MYEQSNSMGTYLFVGVTASAMLIQITNNGEINVMTVVVAILWGLVALGFGKILWEFLGDMVMPYLHREEPESEVVRQVRPPVAIADPPTVIATPFQVPSGEFERTLNKHVNDNKLWAKGMTSLTAIEEEQLRAFYKKRWEAKEDDPSIPHEVGDLLLGKLRERGIADDKNLTEYGKRIIPWGDMYRVANMN